MRILSRWIVAVLCSATMMSAGMNCDLSEYRPSDGLAATVNGANLQLVWQGDQGRPLRALLTISDGQPVIAELAVRKETGAWAVLARDLTPEFEVTSGRRRISEQQLEPLRHLGIFLTPALLGAEKWKAFWDAPLEIPGANGTNPDLPRKPEEIHRAKASCHSTACQVKTNGARLEVTFPGLEMRIFSGQPAKDLLELLARVLENNVSYAVEGVTRCLKFFAEEKPDGGTLSRGRRDEIVAKLSRLRELSTHIERLFELYEKGMNQMAAEILKKGRR